MSSSFGDGLLSDFDLDFLPKTFSLDINKYEKQKRALRTAKHRVISTDAIIEKYLKLKEHRESLQKSLIEEREQYKQVCLDFNNATEKVTSLEENGLQLESKNRELEEKCNITDNLYSATQSHVSQLQSLVKDYQNEIVVLKIENQLEKTGVKEHEKKISSLEKENDSLRNDLYIFRDVVCGKKDKSDEIVKILLKKYIHKKKKHTKSEITEKIETKIEDESCEPNYNLDDLDNSWTDDVSEDCEPEQPQLSLFDAPAIAVSIENNIELIGKAVATQDFTDSKIIQGESKEIAIGTCDIDHDSECSNENEIVHSIDTGRGSSLAFSGSEKCFLSPEYFDNDSPLHQDVILRNDTEVFVENIESNVVGSETTHRATSPNVLETVEAKEIDTTIPVYQLKDVATSPITGEKRSEVVKNVQSEETPICKIVTDPPPNPIEVIEVQVEEVDVCINKSTPLYSSQVITHEADLIEEPCNEMTQNSVDSEVSTILSAMRLDFSLITPLAPSPMPSIPSSNEPLNKTEHISHHTECPGVAKMKEETEGLNVKIASLTQVVTDLQLMMKDFFLNQATKQNEIQDKQDVCSIPNTSCEDTNSQSDAPHKENDEDNYSLTYDDLPEEPSELLNIENTLVDDVSPINESKIMRDLATVIIEEKRVENEQDLTRKSDSHPMNVILQNLFETSNGNENSPLTFCDENSKLEHESKDNHVLKRPKNKMTKLEKLRKKMVPKNKIKTVESPKKKRKSKNTLKIVPPWNKSNELTSSASLNDKDVYEKALAVVAEFRVQQKLKSEKQLKTNKAKAEKCENILKATSTHAVRNNITDDKTTETIQVIHIPNIKSKLENTNDLASSFNMNNVNVNTPCQNKNHKNDSSSNKKRKCPLTPELSPRNTVRITRSKANSNPSSPSYQNKSCTKCLPFENSEETKEQISPVTRSGKKNNKSILFGDETPRQTKKLCVNNACNSEENGDINTLVTELDRIIRRDSLRQTGDISESEKIGSPLAEEMDESINIETEYLKKKSRRNSLKLWIEDCELSISNLDTTSNEDNASLQFEKEKVDNKEKFEHKESCNQVNEPHIKDDVSKINHKIDHLSGPDIADTRATHDTEDENSPSSLLYQEVNKKPEAGRRITRIPSVSLESVDLEKIKMELSRKSSCIQLFKSEDDESVVAKRRNSLKRPSRDPLDVQPKRVLRSSRVSESGNYPATSPTKNKSNVDIETNTMSTSDNCGISKSDTNGNRRESVLCKMIEKYGMKYVMKKPKIVPENVTSSICKKIEEGISAILDLQPAKTKEAMDKLIEDLQRLNHKRFLLGLMAYLKHPDRKAEHYKKSGNHPIPPMTKPEQILLYVIPQLQKRWPLVDIINEILKSIEYSIFRLNFTPDFDVIESLSHFYGVLCRYIRAKNRLRLFMLDAMYCISYKAIPLIRQCLEVWPHVIPLAHMGIAKCPIVVCLVYLLHFFKCENDAFNHVQSIRFILHKKYSFTMSDWGETRMMEFLKHSILELREIPIEKKMLRLALIILAKRQGAKWCQKNIINNLMLPLIANHEVPVRIKQFCISTLGPILKPFPKNMAIHCEIVTNQLFDMLEKTNSHEMEEAIFTALLFTRKHCYLRVQKALLSWHPRKPVSADLEQLFCEYVREKPLHSWISSLSMTNR